MTSEALSPSSSSPSPSLEEVEFTLFVFVTTEEIIFPTVVTAFLEIEVTTSVVRPESPLEDESASATDLKVSIVESIKDMALSCVFVSSSSGAFVTWETI